jgi:hypothetical protein
MIADPEDRAGAERWLDRFFAAFHAREPVAATFIGVHDLDHRLPDFSENGAGDTVAAMRALLASRPASAAARGHRHDTVASPGAPGDHARFQRIDLALARGDLEIRLREYASGHFHRGNPSVYTSEAIFGVLSLLLTDFAPFAERIESAVARLHAVPDLLDQGRRNVRAAPRAWTERALDECTGALAFLREGVDLYIAEAAIDGRRLRVAADVAADAFAAFGDHLRGFLLDRPHERYGCGEEMLALYIARAHCLDASADDIAARAEAELGLAEVRLEEAARALGARTATGALAALADAHPPVDRYYARYEDEWSRARAAAEAHGLLTWPDFPIRYVPRPRWVRAAAPHLYFLFYRSPAAYARPPVHDYLVTPIDADMPHVEQERLLRENNDALIRLNHVIHHGGIGHHVQNWHAFRSASRIGRIAAVDCASRIALPCGGTMAEGWACYATDLMGEIGYLSPLERLAELRGRTRMCARALVDVRLHQGRMTLDEAATLYGQRAGMSAAAARVEAVKNSMNPGMALMYMAGRDAIHELRHELARRPGPRFEVRAFHDRFLSFGSIPVALIADALKDEPGSVDPRAVERSGQVEI